MRKAALKRYDALIVIGEYSADVMVTDHKLIKCIREVNDKEAYMSTIGSSLMVSVNFSRVVRGKNIIY